MHVVCIRMLLSGSICLSTLQKHVVVFVNIYQNGRGMLCPWGVLSYTHQPTVASAEKNVFNNGTHTVTKNALWMLAIITENCKVMFMLTPQNMLFVKQTLL